MGGGARRRGAPRRGGERSRRRRTWASATRSSTSPPTSLQERLARGQVVVLDVRPEPEYRAGHIAGARSAPLTVARRAGSRSCRGDARSSPTAAAPTASTPTTPSGCSATRGFKARRLDVGFPEWRRAGRPVETTPERRTMLLRPFLNDASSCASYLFGCGTHAKLAVVDPHADLVDDYLAAAAALGAPIVAVFETHVQADHVSGLPALVERTGATAYLPADAGVAFEHSRARRRRGGRARQHARHGDRDAGARARPSRLRGRRPAAWQRGAVARVQRRLAADRRRRPPRPARRRRRARPGAPAAREPAAAARAAGLTSFSIPSHYGGSVCGRGLSGNPFSSIGFERAHNPLLALADPEAFADALLAEMPPRPVEQERSSPPTARARSAPSHDASVRLGLRANAHQFGLLVGLNALVGGMVGLERSVLPLVGEEDFGLTLDRRDPRLRRRVRRGQGAHEPRRRRSGRAVRTQTAARRSAGWSRCRCRC